LDHAITIANSLGRHATRRMYGIDDMGWYFSDGQRLRGPYRESDVIVLIDAGLVRGGIIVRWSALGRWIGIASYPPFASAMERRSAARGPGLHKTRPYSDDCMGGRRA
jgi:hypothetical protein